MALKNFFRRIIPHHQAIRGNRPLRYLLGDILHDPDIFHLTRRSSSGGVAAGLFVAFIPLPGHTLYAALLAILFRVNLPLAVLFSYVSNPFTIPPLFYLAYRTGALMLGLPYHNYTFQLSWDGLQGVFHEIWAPLLLGSLMIGLISAGCGYLSVRLLWWLSVKRRWEHRRRSRRQ